MIFSEKSKIKSLLTWEEGFVSPFVTFQLKVR